MRKNIYLFKFPRLFSSGNGVSIMTPFQLTMFVINCNHARRVKFEAAWSSAGVKIEFVNATRFYDPAILEHQQVQGRLDLKQISLVNSHAALYRRLLQSKQKYMLIAEDDVRPRFHFQTSLALALRYVPRDSDWVKLEQCNGRLWGPAFRLAIVAKHGAFTGLYIVSRRGARWLLRANPPEFPRWASDGAMDWEHYKHYGFRKPKGYAVSPPLAWQDKSVSVLAGVDECPRDSA